MSQDKLKTVFPVSVGFVAGEQPNDRKLSGWGTQDKNAFTKVEKALGDLLDSNTHTGTNGGSHAYDLSDRKLGIVSLGRLLGPSGWLNPDFPTNHGTFSVTVTLKCAATEPYARCWILPLKPKTYDSATKTWSNSSITPGGGEAASFVTRRSNLQTVQASGDYYVDDDGGYVYSYRGIDNGTTATLAFNTSMLPDLYEEASFNVIPDWNESTTLCTIATSGTGYTVTCPVMNRDVWLNLVTTGDMTLGPTGDMSEEMVTLHYKSSDANLADVDDPRNGIALKLPAVFDGDLASGDSIPEGFMYLYDNTTGSIIEGATFEYRSQTQVFIQPPAGVTLVVGSARYRLLTVGTNHAEALKAVAMRTIWHKHDGALGEQLISHGVLVDRFLSVGEALVDASRDTYYESTKGVIQNPHPQYLHRSGFNPDDCSVGGNSGARNSGNALRGDLVLSAETAILSTDWLNSSSLVADSFAVYFGGHPDASTEELPYLKLAVNGSAESEIVSTLGMLVMGGTKVQAKEGIAAGNHNVVQGAYTIKTPTLQFVEISGLTRTNATGAHANQVTPGGAQFDIVTWALSNGSLPSQLTGANLANLRSISVRVPWSDIAGPDYGYGIVGGNSELVADAVVFDLVKDYSTPPDNALFVYPLGLWWDSATGTTLLSMAIGDGVNTSSELIVTISYAV